MKITFAQMGNYSIAIRNLMEGLGAQYIPPDKTNVLTIQAGAKIAPETICFPCKVNLGNYLSALQKGADTIAMFDSQGQCRFRYYGMLQRKILKDYGFKVSFVILSTKNFFQQLDCIGKKNLVQKLQVLRLVWKKIRLIELIESKAQYSRPREKKLGQTEKIVRELLTIVDQADTIAELAKLQHKIKSSFNRIGLDRQKKILRVGLIGEIFTVIDSFTNQNIEAALGRMGVEVHRDLTLSTFLKHSLNPFHTQLTLLRARGYLSSIVGGHGLESVAEMLHYADKGYDGVVHLWPFGCMPEVTVRPILDRIKNEKNLPLLGLSLDEQTSQAGIQTRLEAFVDLMLARQVKNI